jgi:hypothetical protein
MARLPFANHLPLKPNLSTTAIAQNNDHERSRAPAPHRKLITSVSFELRHNSPGNLLRQYNWYRWTN